MPDIRNFSNSLQNSPLLYLHISLTSPTKHERINRKNEQPKDERPLDDPCMNEIIQNIWAGVVYLRTQHRCSLWNALNGTNFGLQFEFSREQKLQTNNL